MATTQLKNTQLEFKNTGGSVGVLKFNTDNSLEADRTLKLSNGLVSSSITVGNTGGFSVSTVYQQLSTEDLRVLDTNGNYISLQGSSITTYQLNLPSAQGANGTVLLNDGSGNLSWAKPAVAWTQFGNTITSGFTNSNTKYDLDITSFKNGTSEELFLVLNTNIHSSTFTFYRSLLSSQDYATSSSKFEIGKFESRYILLKVHTNATKIEIQVAGVTLTSIKVYTR